jgi:hypothetical protein
MGAKKKGERERAQSWEGAKWKRRAKWIEKSMGPKRGVLEARVTLGGLWGEN